MPKNIVFCADGTWNGPGQPDSDDQNSPPTNVFKLFLNLDGAYDPGTTQLAKEQERTLTAADGTSSRSPSTSTGSATRATSSTSCLVAGLASG